MRSSCRELHPICQDKGSSVCAGELLHKVSLPVKGPTACTFGGKELNKLFITTMAEGGGSKKGEGGLYVAEIAGVKGVGGAYLAAIA